MVDLESVAEFFDKQSEDYAKFYRADTKTGAAFLFQLRCRLATEMLSGETIGAFLDLATGTGEITQAIALSRDIAGLVLNDISPAMLKVCQRRFGKRPLRGEITWTNQDAFELLRTAQPNRFDAVACLGLIAHTGRLEDLLRLAFASVRPGGVLLLQSSLTDHFGAWATAAYARSPLRRTRYKVSAYSKHDILVAAGKAGFEVADLRRYGLCLPFGDRVLGSVNHQLEVRYAEALTRSGGDALVKLRKPR